MNDKVDLLESLIIDKALRADVSYKFKKIHFFSVAIVFLLLAFIYIYWLMPSNSVKQSRKEDVISSSSALVPAEKLGNSDSPADAVNNFCEKLNLTGYVVATRLANLSSSVYGVIAEVNSEEGSFVNAGDIVAKLDSLQAEYDYDIAKISFEKANVDLESLNLKMNIKEIELNRFLILKDGHFVSDFNLIQLKNDLDILKSNIKSKHFEISQMKLELKKQEKNLQEYVIRAPFSGIIVSLSAKKGEVIAPSAAGGGLTRTGVGSIVDMDSLEVEIDINEKHIQKIREGLPLVVELYAYSGWKFPARIKKIIPISDRGKATIRARVEILIKDNRILPGMAVSVQANESDKLGC